MGFIGLKAVRSFRQSRRAVVESASLLSVIVEALTTRIQRSEASLTSLRSDVASMARQSDGWEVQRAEIRAAYEQTMGQLQQALSNDKKLIGDLEHVKAKLSEISQVRGQQTIGGLPRRENFAEALSEGDMLSTLTSTERRTLEILRIEGSIGAPELGKRLEKSREHTSRLMKKLYMEGYVNRESNHSPFRYKLNDEVRSALESIVNQATAERSEIS